EDDGRIDQRNLLVQKGPAELLLRAGWHAVALAGTRLAREAAGDGSAVDVVAPAIRRKAGLRQPLRQPAARLSAVGSGVVDRSFGRSLADDQNARFERSRAARSRSGQVPGINAARAALHSGAEVEECGCPI